MGEKGGAGINKSSLEVNIDDEKDEESETARRRLKEEAAFECETKKI